MKQFTNGNGTDRNIYIDTDEVGFINFYYVDNYKRTMQYVLDMQEREIPIEEDDAVPQPFYSIMKDYWIADTRERLDREDNFHYHMKQKNWFTQEMYNYINKQLNVKEPCLNSIPR